MIVIHRAFLLTRECLKKRLIKSLNSELFITAIQSALISLYHATIFSSKIFHATAYVRVFNK